MKAKALPSQERLLQLFEYQPLTGLLLWRERSDLRAQWNSRYAGKTAGTISGGGRYWDVQIDAKAFKVHRIAYKMMTGDEPEEIDHKDGDSLNNRFENFRPTDRSGNCRNTRCRKDSQFKLKGVGLKQGKWRARIWLDGKSKHLGWFGTENEAKAAYDAAAIRNFGEFARVV